MTTRPAKFYKYRHAAGEAALYLERIVCHNEIYFAAPVSFNDPFDCTAVFAPEVGTDEELMQSYMVLARRHGPPMSDVELRRDAEAMLADPTRNPRNESVRNDIQDEYARTVRATTDVYCLSEVRDDILMWSHYADYHRGVCLEFDGGGKLAKHAMKVRYAHEGPAIAQQDSNKIKLDKGLLTKSNHWQYEKEWRLIRYRGGPGVEVFGIENLTGISVGAQAPTETLKLVRRLSKARSQPLKLYKATTSRNTFTVNIHEIAA